MISSQHWPYTLNPKIRNSCLNLCKPLVQLYKALMKTLQNPKFLNPLNPKPSNLIISKSRSLRASRILLEILTFEHGHTSAGFSLRSKVQAPSRGLGFRSINPKPLNKNLAKSIEALSSFRSGAKGQGFRVTGFIKGSGVDTKPPQVGNRIKDN